MMKTRFSALLILVSIATVVSSTPVDIARESSELADTLTSGVQLALAQHVDLLPQTEDSGNDDDDTSIEVDITPATDSASAEEADGLDDEDDTGLEYPGEEEEMIRLPMGAIGKIAGKGLGRLGKKLPKLLGKKLPKLKIKFRGRKMPKIKIRTGKGKGKGRGRARPSSRSRSRSRQRPSRQRSRRPSRPQQEQPSQPEPTPAPAPAPPPAPEPAPEPLPDPSVNPVPVLVPIPNPAGGGGEPVVNPDPNPVPPPPPVQNPAEGGGGEFALGLARMPEYSYADIVNLCLGEEPKFECFFQDQDSEDAFRNDEEAQKGTQWFGWF